MITIGYRVDVPACNTSFAKEIIIRVSSKLLKICGFLINCAVECRRKWLAYFYAVVLSLWSTVIPLTAGSLSVVNTLEIASEKVSSYDQSTPAFLVNQNSSYQSFSFRTAGDNPNIHFFNEGDFQFVFLKNIFATAFLLFKGGDINFEFIDLIYPFHYFW